jgi:flagellar basal body L-ring protein FlgH
MRGLKRWVLVFPIALSIMAAAIANAKPVAPDASAAEAAIADAEAAIRQAQAQRALWTSAEDALRKARRALQEGDTTMAVEQARIAQKHSELGIAQISYPPFR